MSLNKKIDKANSTALYLQLAEIILTKIKNLQFLPGEKLPSINEMLADFDTSRDTIIKAYRHLLSIGNVTAVQGKGYYVKHKPESQKPEILVLFNKLSAHKKLIYDAFAARVGKKARIDLLVYNNDFDLFSEWIKRYQYSSYAHIVVVPHFLKANQQSVAAIIEQIPKEKLLILDKLVPGLKGSFSAVYQDFSEDLYLSLEEGLHLLTKYRRLNLIFPTYSYHPKEIREGFHTFCKNYHFDGRIVPNVATVEMEVGDVYINLMEDDLVTLIKRVRSNSWQVGKDIGIISYNETPLKEILLDGITVISTDFEQLGNTAADLILSGKVEQLRNPFGMVIRNTL